MQQLLMDKNFSLNNSGRDLIGITGAWLEKRTELDTLEMLVQWRQGRRFGP